MTYIANTNDQQKAMLERCSAASIDALFDSIPGPARAKSFRLPAGSSELETHRYFEKLSDLNATRLVGFLGGGVYDHYVPAVIDAIVSRGEFYTAYTPYQAEASQGTLQAIYEYQSDICRLTDLEVANASLYDGGTALVEACQMALHATGRAKIVIGGGVHPVFRRMLLSHMGNLSLDIRQIAPSFGSSDREALLRLVDSSTAAVVVQNPDFFGTVDDYTEVAAHCHQHGALALVSVNPVACAVLKTPGEMGFDIATGEGQPLGLPLSFGGPYLGFMATRRSLIRKMPGRIVGRTVDTAGREGFVLTLQAREQHIRREKATSNICSNQALCALRAHVFLTLVGKEGLRELALLCRAKTEYAKQRLARVPGVEIDLQCASFNEFTIRVPMDATELVKALIGKGFAAGLPLSVFFPQAPRTLLFAVTEKRTKDEIDRFAQAFEEVLRDRRSIAEESGKSAAVSQERPSVTVDASAKQTAKSPAEPSTPAEPTRSVLPVHGSLDRGGTKVLRDELAVVASINTNPLPPTLVFDKSVPGRRGFTYPALDVPAPVPLLERYARSTELRLCELSELDVVRHFTRLSQKNYSVDTHFYPLGSCTMKYSPKICEKVAAFPGFASLHPLMARLPGGDSLAQGALEAIAKLERLLCEVTGMDAFTLQPLAGAHGELTGMLLAAAYHRHKRNRKTEVLIPDEAHGTNPSSATMAGFQVRAVPTRGETGTIDLAALESMIGERTAALMLTNPNTLGLFNSDIEKISALAHKHDCLLYYDGANFNAVLGRFRPGDGAFDIVHLNLHKTFATPHGGGGPGAGPVGVKKALERFLPVPRIIEKDDGRFAVADDYPDTIGPVASFYGNFAVCLKAYAYILMLGADGLKRVSDHAVLNANYLLHSLKDAYHAPYPKGCMHECVISAKKQMEYGIHALDIAKALIDEGFHPPTAYFPLIVKEALMIEPTETESKETLDSFIRAMNTIAAKAVQDPDSLRAAPITTPVTRLDETRAARELDVAY